MKHTLIFLERMYRHGILPWAEFTALCWRRFADGADTRTDVEFILNKNPQIH